MAEYLSRDTILRIINHTDSIPLFYRNLLQEKIKLEHRADVVEVKHGEWIDRSDKGVISMSHPYMCSRCFRVEAIKEPYCNCGAKMDGANLSKKPTGCEKE